VDDSTGAVYELAAASFVGAGVEQKQQKYCSPTDIGNGPLVIDELMAVYISWIVPGFKSLGRIATTLFEKRKPVVCRC